MVDYISYAKGHDNCAVSCDVFLKKIHLKILKVIFLTASKGFVSPKKNKLRFEARRRYV
jgi:hypothetical protein